MPINPETSRQRLAAFAKERDKAGEKESNLYYEDYIDKHKVYFKMSDKDWSSYAELLDIHGESFELRYQWPSVTRRVVRLSVRVYYMPHNNSPSQKRTRSYSLMLANVKMLLEPLFDCDDGGILDKFTFLCSPEPPVESEGVLQGMVSFDDVWMRQEDLRALRLIFKWHPQFKDKFEVNFAENNIVPFGRHLVLPYDFDIDKHTSITPEIAEKTFPMSNNKSKGATVSFSPRANQLHREAEKVFREWKLELDNKDAATRARKQKDNFDPTNAIIDLTNFDQMNDQWVIDNFDYNYPEKVFRYLDMFFADVYKEGTVWVKGINNQGCLTFKQDTHENVIKMMRHLEYEHFPTSDATGAKKSKSIKGNIVDLYFKKGAKKYHNTIFAPGKPTVMFKDCRPSGAAYLDKFYTLNTCPPPVYLNYRRCYVDPAHSGDLPPTFPPLEYGGKLDPRDPNFEKQFFKHVDGDEVYTTFMNKCGDLATRSRDWDRQVEEEGAEMCLWIVLFHIWFVLCNRNRELFDRFNAWFARLIFDPAHAAKQFLVIYGFMGVGKTNFINSIGKWCLGAGNLYLYMGGNSDRLTSNFNSHLDQCIFMAVDEGKFGKDNNVMSVLKSMCTDEYRMSEPKFGKVRMVESHLSMCIITDNTEGLPVEIGDRRYNFYECSQELAAEEAYHSIVQPRFERMFSMLVYARWLERSPKLLDNAYVNFYKRPVMTAAKKQCVLAMVETAYPELAWWHACINEKKVRGLQNYVDTDSARQKFAYRAVLAKGGISVKTPLVTEDCYGNFVNTFEIELEEARLRLEAQGDFVSYAFAKDKQCTDYKSLLTAFTDSKPPSKYGEGSWPFKTTLDDLYAAFVYQCKSAGNKILVNSFIEHLKSCVTFQVNKRGRARFPCVFGARAQFEYFLTYKCVRDNGRQYALPTYDRDEQPDACETWVDLLERQARVEGLPPKFHRYCQQCRLVSQLWRLTEQKHRAEDGVRRAPAVAVPVSPEPAPKGKRAESCSTAEGSQPVGPANHGYGHGQRAEDTPESLSPASQSAYDSLPPDVDMVGVQPGCAGLGGSAWSRVQDQSDEAGPSDRPQQSGFSPLHSSPDEFTLLTPSPYSSMDSDV